MISKILKDFLNKKLNSRIALHSATITVKNKTKLSYVIQQWFSTRAPRAACGPQVPFVRLSAVFQQNL